MAWKLRPAPFTGYAVLLIAAAALYGAALTVALFQANWVFTVPLAVATLAPLVIYASRNPRLFFLVGMVFTAPLGLSINLRPHAHMGGAHALSINLMDFFLVPALVFLARDFYLGYRRDFRISSISFWWLGLTALGVLSMIINPFRELAGLEVVRMLKCWLLFLVIINECVREKHFRYVVGALGANAAVNIVVAFMQYFLGRTLGLQPLGEGSDLSALGANLGVYAAPTELFRVMGLAGHANLFSAYLAMLLPIFISQLFTDYRLSVKLLFAALSATGVVCLGLTLSRSGWLSFAMSGGCLMIALFALPDLRKRYLLMKVSMIGAATAILVAGSGMILRRFLESDPGAFDFRVEWVGIAWRMVQAKPVLGLGLNSFIYNLQDYAPYSVPKLYDLFGEVFPVVHNTYMLVWAEQGTIGLLLFLAMHVNLLRIAVLNLRYRGLNERIYLIGIASACGILGIMVDYLSSFFIRVQPFGRVYWIVAGLLVATHYWNLNNSAALQQSEQGEGPGPEGGAARETAVAER
jgi:putative inorganic carbon (hco3(-)) transporter